GHTVPAMSGQEQPVSGRKFPIVGLILDAQPRTAGDEQHELISALIEPIVFRGDLARRDNPLDEKAWGLDQSLEQLCCLRPDG
ncbi:MAG: hypothetical protein AAGF09_03495, partial [Pseudomonadota bacterium]